MTAFSEQKKERKDSRNPCGSTGKSNPNGQENKTLMAIDKVPRS
jgi:hypothetical protein